MTTITDTILGDPILLALLALVIRAGLAWQRSLTWPEYRTLHGVKRLAFPRLDARLPGVNLVNEKGYVDDGEYLDTVPGSVRSVVKQLTAAGGSLHLINSIKRRSTPNGPQLSAAHVVWTHDDGNQTEVYLFGAVDGGTDVYAHHEESVTNPDGHLTNFQTDGDPRGVVTAALAGDGDG